MDKETAHKRLLDILCVFDGFCTKHHIRYTLHGGTLLGAVRGNEFIPWDDDADIAMTRAEYRKLEVAVEDFSPEYYIRGSIKKQFCRKDDPDIWVDLFVCDYITENKFLRKVKLGLLTVLDVMHRDRESMKLSNLQEYSRMKQLVYKVVFAVGQLIPRKWITKCHRFVSEKCFLGNKTEMFRSSDHYAGRKRIFPKQWMERYQRVSFAGKELPVLVNYDELLFQCYGADYMIPMIDERNEEIHSYIRSGKRIDL